MWMVHNLNKHTLKAEGAFDAEWNTGQLLEASFAKWYFSLLLLLFLTFQTDQNDYFLINNKNNLYIF